MVLKINCILINWLAILIKHIVAWAASPEMLLEFAVLVADRSCQCWRPTQRPAAVYLSKTARQAMGEGNGRQRRGVQWIRKLTAGEGEKERR